MVWGCFSHDHKLDLKVVKQTLTGQRYIEDILELIVYPHFLAHQAARPIIQDDNARPHRARIVTDSLAQEGIENLQWPSRSPNMNRIEHVWDRMGRNVCKRNDVATLDDHVRALVDVEQFGALAAWKTSARYATASTRVTTALRRMHP